jgi:hypothetical protein
MKNLSVYWSDGRWYGSEITWKRSGSGSYRETSPIEIPQTKAEIDKFARENQYAVEWRQPLPEEAR